ncbi:hypothetical protein [Streptomyces fildesensis]|uniref:hypothetical protein n=1 Tax=Streptomyces fildesensis TaxID=375757 RepID=UPI0018DFBD37|nr:hypothetical protein [Streptomyces fildesensis]
MTQHHPGPGPRSSWPGPGHVQRPAPPDAHRHPQAELAAARAQNDSLRCELADAQDEVIAVREAGRQMSKNVNRSR